MKQRTLAMMTDFEQYTSKTRRAIFLEEMEQVVPWRELCAPMEPHYPKAGNGGPPVGSRANAADLIFSAVVQPVGPSGRRGAVRLRGMRQFVGIDFGWEPVPLLEEQQLGEPMLGKVNLHLQAKGCELRPARSWTRPSMNCVQCGTRIKWEVASISTHCLTELCIGTGKTTPVDIPYCPQCEELP
jgi:hypothetical protein